MKLPKQQFHLPILENVSNVFREDGLFVRSANSFKIKSKTGQAENIILNMKANKNTKIRCINNAQSDIEIFQDYSFLYIENAENIEIIADNEIELKIRLCISYLPPLKINNEELFEKLNKLGRYRILTPEPHLGELVCLNEHKLSDPKNCLLPLGRTAEETHHELEIDLEELLKTTPTPQKMEIESTGFCNLKCVHCPQGLEGGMPYGPDPISKDLVAELDGFIQNAKHIHLHGYGEPLASPRTWDILGKIEGTDVTAEFNSNGVLLNKKSISKIISSNNLRRINISIDSTNKQRFYRIRGAELGDVISNVRNLLNQRDVAGRSNLSIAITMVIMKENLVDVLDMIRLAADLDVPVMLWNLKSNNTFFDSTSFKSIREWKVNRDDWLFEYAEQIPFSHPDYQNVVSSAIKLSSELGVEIHGLSDWPNDLFPGDEDDYLGLESKPSDCPYYKDSLYVTSNGDVRLCCYQIGSAPLGNLANKSASEIWNGPELNEVRALLKEDKIPNICSRATCQYVKGK